MAEKQKRGFALMSPERRREAGRKGGAGNDPTPAGEPPPTAEATTPRPLKGTRR